MKSPDSTSVIDRDRVVRTRDDFRSIASDLRQSLGLNSKSVIDLRTVCDAFHVEVRRSNSSPEEIGTAALLAPRAGGFVVLLSAPIAMCRNERRFAVAHELGHVLFYNRMSLIPSRNSDPCRSEERFCNGFARSLLLSVELLAEAKISDLATLADAHGIPLRHAAIEAAHVWGFSLTFCTQREYGLTVNGGVNSAAYPGAVVQESDLQPDQVTSDERGRLLFWRTQTLSTIHAY